LWFGLARTGKDSAIRHNSVNKIKVWIISHVQNIGNEERNLVKVGKEEGTERDQVTFKFGSLQILAVKMKKNG
jgi:hypothetical protein